MDTILFNGRVATMDPACPSATAVSIENGRFAAVGDDREILALRTPAAVFGNPNRTSIIPRPIDHPPHLIRGV